MSLPTEEFARRIVVRVLAAHTELVEIQDKDPTDTNENPALVRVITPKGLLKLSLAGVGLNNQQQVELLRAELRIELPLIDGELAMVKLSPATVLGKLRDFIRAALDMKLTQ
jgi:hypothetical protein